jgi:hypothetical protein
MKRCARWWRWRHDRPVPGFDVPGDGPVAALRPPPARPTDLAGRPPLRHRRRDRPDQRRHPDHGRYAGAPQKYHATISRAWVELVGHHADASDATDFDTFAEQNAALLDKRLLTRFYRSSTLAGAEAKTAWVEPDLAPFPWLA